MLKCKRSIVEIMSMQKLVVHASECKVSMKNVFIDYQTQVEVPKFSAASGFGCLFVVQAWDIARLKT